MGWDNNYWNVCECGYPVDLCPNGCSEDEE